MINKLLVSLLTISLLWSGYASAQQKPQLSLLSEEVDNEARSCGIDKSSIEAISALTLRNNGIQVMPSQLENPFLYVQVTVLNTTNSGRGVLGCAVYTHVQVKAISRKQPPLGGIKARIGPADIVFCSSGELSTGPAQSMGERFLISLEKNIKLCLGKLDY